MRTLFTLIIALLFFGCNSNQPSNELIVSGDNKIMVLDTEHSSSDSLAIVWEWSAEEAISQIPTEYQKRLMTIDECKPYDNGDRILVTSSGGATLLLDRKTKECLFYAYTPNAHSAEILPNNRIVVALSYSTKGNSVELYDIANSERVIFRDSLYSGHGVVWDNSRERLFALGFDELREYSLANWDSEKPSLKLEKTHIIPREGGHDLVQISDDELLISAHDGVDVFNIETETFSAFEQLANVKNVKSVYYDKTSEKLIYTKGGESWWTNNIHFENPTKTLTIKDIRLYKVRPI